MKVEAILKELEDAARQLGLEVRRDRGSFRGGRCTVTGQEYIVLNKRHLPETQLAVLAECLRDLPMDTVFLKPSVRKALEEAWIVARDVDVEAADDA
jgi:hypothetical protein